ncbi:MAG: DUF1365 family protein [Alphaproteobacteria bacterium]|nr:DUF1365 family protein [Alphaproteobacteria bacterium]
MIGEAKILNVGIAHARQGAHANRFAYRALYVALPLKALARQQVLLFSVGRFNLFAFHARDHGDGGDPEAWARGILRERGLSEADGDIVLVTLPRVLGYVFNPVSFWLCHDRRARLRAVIAEVNNTFGGRHVYVCSNEDGQPIESADRFTCAKEFYVSPFLETEGEYHFRFDAHADRFGAWIDYADVNGPRLSTSMVGRMIPLTSTRLLAGFVRIPFVTLKIIALIHWQALRLMLKGAAYRAPPPAAALNSPAAPSP